MSDDDRWVVSTDRVGGSIHVYPTKGYMTVVGLGVPNVYVDAPNFLERALGISSSDKVSRAKGKCQIWCDKENANEDWARAMEALL
jgi:hypothetical protein